MSTFDYKRKRLNREEARKLVVKLAAEGRVSPSLHARARLRERDLIFNDVVNVLLANSMRISDGELENGCFRYRCQTNRFIVVVGFFSRGDGLIVVTVFRAERKER